jgi:hypothetical protein
MRKRSGTLMLIVILLVAYVFANSAVTSLSNLNTHKKRRLTRPQK